MKKKVTDLCVSGQVRNRVLANGVSQSQLVDFAVCPQRWVFRVLGLVPKGGEVSEAATFGSVMHALLAKLYLAAYEAQAKREPVRDVSESRVRWAAEVRKEIGGQVPAGAGQMFERVCGMAEAVFEAYCKVREADYASKTFVMRPEVRIDGKADGLPIYAYADAVYRDAGGGLYVMEHKCWGRIDEDALELGLGIDFQSLLHVWLMARSGRGKSNVPRGVLYNVIRQPQIKQGQQPLAEFCQRITQDCFARPEFYFIRKEVTYTQTDLRTFEKRELAWVVSRMKDALAGRPYTICRNSAACLGRRTCDYLGACGTNNAGLLTRRE